MKKIIILLMSLCVLSSCENYDLLGIGEYRFYISTSFYEEHADFIFQLKSNSKVDYDFIDLKPVLIEEIEGESYGVFEILIPNGTYFLEVDTDRGYHTTESDLGLISRSQKKEIVLDGFDLSN